MQSFGDGKRPMGRGLLKFVCRLGSGLAIGVTLGAAIWAVTMVAQGHTLPSAVRGEVEDGLGLLQGLAALGGLCGSVVGMGWGLVRLVNGETTRRRIC